MTQSETLDLPERDSERARAASPRWCNSYMNGCLQRPRCYPTIRSQPVALVATASAQMKRLPPLAGVSYDFLFVRDKLPLAVTQIQRDNR
jgi:hypothetical protein